MTDSTTKRMLASYLSMAGAPMFLAGWFRSPEQNYHTTEKVEVDVERDEPDIAVPVQDLSVGSRHNKSTKYTNKAFTPPVFNESATITAYDTIHREPGDIPYDDPVYIANARARAMRTFPKLERKIRRSIEVMASQVLQTGQISLVDENGSVIHSEDFQPKSTHFPTVGTDWGTGTENKLTDVASLARTVRRDGKARPNVLVFGETAFDQWISDSDVKERLDNRRFNLGEVAPEARGEGATFQGFVWIGNYRFEMWTYDADYLDPQTGNHTPFIADDKVIMLSRNGRLDLTFGAIPRIRPPQADAQSFLPPATRLMDGSIGLDLSVNAWFSPDGQHLHVSAGTRPLTIPTAIDTFGCLDTAA